MFNKIIIVVIVSILTGIACKNHDHVNNATTSGQDVLINSVRDRSINENNAYNDLFLDSADVEKFIATARVNDTLAVALKNFYNARNFEYAWFASTGLIEQAFSFHSLYCTENDTDVFNKSMERCIDKIRVEEDSVIDAKDPVIIKTELQLSLRFIKYALENYSNKNITATDLGLYIPAKKMTIEAMANAMLADNKANRNYVALNAAYASLKTELGKYYSLAKNGGWPVITMNAKKFDSGSSDPAIIIIKKRLQITGEFSGQDTTSFYNNELVMAVKEYQYKHGFKETGSVNPALVKDLNIPAMARVQQLLVNMQRMRWMPTRPEGKLIIVNIPEFEVYVDSGKINLFHMDVVVGAEGHNTTMFSGKINQVVFSPYWDVPPSIVKKEVLPGLKRNKDYLTKRDMEITGNEGGLPVVRQKPGDKNALGKVKFLFPNSFNIYMHDTPEKGFFKRSERDLSHGCIRLSNAPKMAHYLLQNAAAWPPEKIDSAMNSEVEQFVKLSPAVPVIITYYTAWVDDKLKLHFADDIYMHDSKIAKKMFSDPLLQ
jgi:murein L,D-transpeptidase YcbB/YkuD